MTSFSQTRPAPLADKWIRRASRGQIRQRLFCFPYAGGSAAIFQPWLHSPPAHTEVCAIEIPGRLARLHERAHTELPAFIGALDLALAGQLDLPFALFGYSLGGLMAFEWARALRRRCARQPSQLIVAACRAPQLPSHSPAISELPDRAFLTAIEERYEPVDPLLRGEPDMLARILRILRTDLRMFERYHYQAEAPFDYPMLVVGGSHDLGIGRERLEGWQAQTSNTCRVEVLPGNHFFLRNQAQQLMGLIDAFICRPVP